jgi:hypothetical protein
MAAKPARAPIVTVPDESALGPAMRACNVNQRAFVIALLETGGSSKKLAAKMAGYGLSDNASGSAGSSLSRHPKVLAALKEEADRRIRSGAVLAASVLLEIAEDPLHKDRFKAAQELLNRSGLIVETQHRVVVEDQRSTDEIERRILTLAEKLGIDPVKLLGYVPATGGTDIIDGECTDVEDDGSEGLEDIL